MLFGSIPYILIYKISTIIISTFFSTVNLPSTLYFEELGKERVKALYDKYEIDFKMFDYSIEPYLSYAANTLGVGNKIKSFN